VPEGCAAGAAACICAGTACDAGLYCGSNVCRTCTNEVAGCPCAAGACAGALQCDAGTCRAPKTCDTLGCAVHQRCAPGSATSDARCTGSCEPGFAWNATTRACDAVAGATCAAGGSASIVDACAALHRPCVVDGTPVHCGACLDGFVEEERACRAVKTCDALACANNHLACTPASAHADAICGACAEGYVQAGSLCVPVKCADIAARCSAEGKGCVESTGGGAVCSGCRSGLVMDAATGACRAPYTCATLPAPCAAPKTCREGSAATDAVCVDPTCPACNGPGEDGPWGERMSNGTCVCKTKPGYFYSLSGSIGTWPCDADGDGWVRDSAWTARNHPEKPVRDNARCTVRVVKRFVLENDRGEKKVIPVVPGGGGVLADGLPLYETVRNDDATALARAPLVPAYGRALLAQELNGLTKACVTENADFNDNKVSDVEEWGRPGGAQEEQSKPMPPYADLAPAFELYTRFSYFLELHRGWYAEDVDPASPGGAAIPSYHIAERDRLVAKGEFPLRYAASPDGTYTSDLWQDCRRSRDAWYDDSQPATTMDFASASRPGPGWMGMNHHSQFKCVQVIDEGTFANMGPGGRRAQRHLQAACALGDGTKEAPGCKDAKEWAAQDKLETRDYLRASVAFCEATAAGAAPASGNPVTPSFVCTPASAGDARVTTGKVLWTAVRIAESSQYARGCMLQCPGYPFICPGTAPGKDPAPCYSLCGEPTASEWRIPPAGSAGLRLRGGVPVLPVADWKLEGPATAGKYTVQAR
jgi:hypothetical protein